MEKLGMWLLMLIAVVFLARPQGAAAVEEPQYIASTDCADGGSDSGSIILTVVIIVIIIGALLLGGLYALFGETIMPTVTQKVKDMFDFNG